MVFVYQTITKQKQPAYMEIIDGSKFGPQRKGVLKKELEELGKKGLTEKELYGLAIYLVKASSAEEIKTILGWAKKLAPFLKGLSDKERLALIYDIGRMAMFYHRHVTHKEGPPKLELIKEGGKVIGFKVEMVRKGMHDNIVIEVEKRKEGWIINFEGLKIKTNNPLILMEFDNEWKGPYLIAKGDTNKIIAVDLNGNNYAVGTSWPYTSSDYKYYSNIMKRGKVDYKKWQDDVEKATSTGPSQTQSKPTGSATKTPSSKSKLKKKEKPIPLPTQIKYFWEGKYNYILEEVGLTQDKIDAFLRAVNDPKYGKRIRDLISLIFENYGVTVPSIKFVGRLIKEAGIKKEDDARTAYMKLLNYLLRRKSKHAQFKAKDKKDKVLLSGEAWADVKGDKVVVYVKVKPNKGRGKTTSLSINLKQLGLKVEDGKVVEIEKQKPPQAQPQPEQQSYSEDTTKELRNAIKKVREGKETEVGVKVGKNEYTIKKEGNKVFVETKAGRFDITHLKPENIHVRTDGGIEIVGNTLNVEVNNTTQKINYTLVIMPGQDKWDVNVALPSSAKERAEVMYKLITQLRANDILTDSTGVNINGFVAPSISPSLPTSIPVPVYYSIPAGAKNITVAVVKEGGKESVAVSFEKGNTVMEQYGTKKDIDMWNVKAQGIATQVIVKEDTATIIVQKKSGVPGTAIHIPIKKEDKERIAGLKGKEVMVYEQKYTEGRVKHKVVVKEKDMERELIFEKRGTTTREKRIVGKEKEKVTTSEEQQEVKKKKETLLDKITKIRNGLAKVSYGAMILGGVLGLLGVATTGLWSVVFTITSVIAAISMILSLIGQIKYIKDNFERLKKEGKLTEAYLTLARDVAIAALFGLNALSFIGIKLPYGLYRFAGKTSSLAMYLLMLYNLVKPKTTTTNKGKRK